MKAKNIILSVTAASALGFSALFVANNNFNNNNVKTVVVDNKDNNTNEKKDNKNEEANKVVELKQTNFEIKSVDLNNLLINMTEIESKANTDKNGAIFIYEHLLVKKSTEGEKNTYIKLSADEIETIKFLLNTDNKVWFDKNYSGSNEIINKLIDGLNSFTKIEKLKITINKSKEKDANASGYNFKYFDEIPADNTEVGNILVECKGNDFIEKSVYDDAIKALNEIKNAKKNKETLVGHLKNVKENNESLKDDVINKMLENCNFKFYKDYNDNEFKDLKTKKEFEDKIKKLLSTNANGQEEKKGLGAGAITAIVLCSLAGAVVIGGTLYYFLYYKKKKNQVNKIVEE